jgi:hypothetical protein
MFWIGSTRWLTPTVIPVAGSSGFTLLIFDHNGANASAIRPIKRARIRVWLAITARWFTMRYVDLIAPWTSGVGCSRVMGHLLLGLQRRRWLRYTIFWPGDFARIAFA